VGGTPYMHPQYDPSFGNAAFSNVSDGRQLSWILNLAIGSAGAFFFAEHSTNTGNTVLLICHKLVGLTGTGRLNTSVDMVAIVL